ncbi:MAG: serine/threonine protein kinase [Myxococcales bacterium]|nr:MAG: serine/threonine protein kinase [Myxococcales bacterium]
MANGPQGTPQRLGDYEVVQWIATGGMAEVYVGRRRGARGFTKQVALKRILPQFATDSEFVAMFTDEARLCATLTHPNLVEVFDFGEDGGELFMAMELVEGTTCARLVRAAAARGEAVPIEDALFIVLNVLRGLEYAHDAEDEDGRPLNLVHRDVSPGNVLVSRTGAVKLTDFGIVRAAHIERRTDTGQLKGKLGYMSPEQVTGRELDRRSDLFTVGILLAELLTGRPLFSFGVELDILFRIRDADATTFLRYSGDLPPELSALVLRALAREPGDRFQSAGAFAEAIEELVRARRLTLGPVRLGAYVEALGLVRPGTRSGEFRARGLVDSTPRAKPLRSAEAPTLDDGGPATYRLRLGDGTTQGPMPLTRVLEALITGRASFEVGVSRNDGPFRPASEHPELRRIAASSAHRWDVSITSRDGSRFLFDPRSLPAQLCRLAVTRDTALVMAIHDQDRKKLYVADGMLVHSSSTDASELIGERLLRSGRILPVELDMALALAPRHGGHVGDALVGLGILRPRELYEEVYAQTRLRATEILRWRQGELWVFPGVKTQEDVLPQGLPMLEVVAQGLLAAHDEETLRKLLTPVLESPLRPGPRTGPSVLSLRLPPGPERALLGPVGLSLAELILKLTREGVATSHEVMAGVFIGLVSGVLEAPGWPALPPR